jgi:2-keto-4-pentenoate hydratase/2-oxohepta-3-ene-1,7-dioic acid hydratase in catechol pathway
MRLATVHSSRGLRAAAWCRVHDGDVWLDLAEAAAHLLDVPDFPFELREVLRLDGPGLSTVRQIVVELEGGEPPVEIATWPGRGARLTAPIPSPGAFLDFYAFEEHVRGARARRGLDIVPEWYRYPVYYRSNQRAMHGPDADIRFPAGETKMDYELELAAVLGTAVRDPTPDEAEAAIVGWCLLNDWSARAIQAETMKVGLGPNKGKDFATSLGPWIVTPDELGDVSELELEARVNGEVWSRGRVGAMHWRWGEMLAFAAEGVRFEPGDVFGSGTVGGGCGLELDRFLSDGDRVELDGGPLLGVLAGTVRQSG